MKKTAKRYLIILAVLTLGCGILGWGYVRDYYHAQDTAYEVIRNQEEGIIVSGEKDRFLAFIPEEPTAGLIFYPGGKVQYEAYAPLMEACAEKGILSVVLHMPANLAVLDRNAADGYKEMFPEVTDWYIGGHSLGGVISAMYLKDHADEYEGLVLLASYATVDLSKENLKVLSIYGSEDGVLDMDKYAENISNLPEDLTESVIEGGCHAFFGSYGRQEGDGEPSITNREQIRRTAELIGEMCGL